MLVAKENWWKAGNGNAAVALSYTTTRSVSVVKARSRRVEDISDAAGLRPTILQLRSVVGAKFRRLGTVAAGTRSTITKHRPAAETKSEPEERTTTVVGHRPTTPELKAAVVHEPTTKQQKLAVWAKSSRVVHTIDAVTTNPMTTEHCLAA